MSSTLAAKDRLSHIGRFINTALPPRMAWVQEDVETILAELSRLEEENARLIREADGRARADANYRKRWKDHALLSEVDEVRRHVSGLRPRWAEALAELQSGLLHSEEENAKLREALEPFGGEFASTFVNDDGWTGPMSKTRIVDWFGPSDFRRAASLISKGGADV